MKSVSQTVSWIAAWAAILLLSGSAFSQTVEQRLTAIEARLDVLEGRPATQPTTPATQPVSDATVITSFSQIRGAGNYRLVPSDITLTEGFNVPSNVTLDVTGSTIRLNVSKWLNIFEMQSVNNVTIVGGTYFTGRNNCISEPRLCNNITFRNITLAEDSGFAFKVHGGSNITVDGLKATKFLQYIMFADSYVLNLTLANLNVVGGSKDESTIRVVGVNNLVIRDSKLHSDLNLDGAKKNVAMRLHQGTNFEIKNVEVRGVVGLGPMAGGDGGQQWGTTQWIGPNGEWGVTRERADVTKTMDLRRQALDIKTIKVRISNMRVIEGHMTLNPGLIDAVWDGGELTKIGDPTQRWNQAACFQNIQREYPDGTRYAQKLPGDPVRGLPQLIVRNVRFKGSELDPSGVVRFGTGVLFKDTPVAASVQ